ncbi:putative N-formylglutamate amidohydrolase [Ulvibacter sp. MAR_2010_11]|uniref:N-formylglutamate amidohydrolase n=1 Tax=Ulvibacter sp. MAR_2010_11 TaxID=1250229 RepID=UPI000C2C9FE0|nr:N-formylglutamate amidohydrolase [Ulvibacter sp. MAR_2010_11]PKA83730.1 putative N-formylglutamate amidohydrolase [Ulvibacter sp. MAR_2010_11]
MKLILSCEHGGNEIPAKYLPLFEGQEASLQTHRGYDPGTLDLFEYLKSLAVFGKSNVLSRLLIECNRSLHHPKLFSEITKDCTQETKDQLIETYYLPYRNALVEAIEKEIRSKNTVLHISLHSFTPQLSGKIRNNDIGLLYDSKRKEEKQFCEKLKLQLKTENKNLKIRNNYPYLGNADGFTSFLRKKFKNNYIGIELEINQALVTENKFPKQLKLQLKNTLSLLIS